MKIGFGIVRQLRFENKPLQYLAEFTVDDHNYLHCQWSENIADIHLFTERKDVYDFFNGHHTSEFLTDDIVQYDAHKQLFTNDDVSYRLCLTKTTELHHLFIHGLYLK